MGHEAEVFYTHPLFFLGAALALALVPFLLGMFTSYLKISIVLGVIRNGLGTQQVPSGVIVSALSLAITLQILAPVFEESVSLAERADLGAIKGGDLAEIRAALAPVLAPWRRFIEHHAGERELGVLVLDRNISAADRTAIPFSIVATAFTLTELKEAFSMAFVVLLPFLIIDLIVANVLIGLGMTMVSPVMISLPLKLIVFVISDAWLYLFRGLLNSYGG